MSFLKVQLVLIKIHTSMLEQIAVHFYRPNKSQIQLRHHCQEHAGGGQRRGGRKMRREEGQGGGKHFKKLYIPVHLY